MEESTDQFQYFDTILKEAAESDLDQLVMVPREDMCHLYMLSNGRILKGITFEKNITHAFVEYFTEKEFPEPIQETHLFELNTITSIALGKCFSVKIVKKEA
jgi:hypothetical protein